MTRSRQLAMCIGAVLWILGLASLCRADGLIVIQNPPTPIPGHFPFAPLEVRYHHVDVRIEDQVAVTAIDQEFYNPSGQRLEGMYLFPLPEGAHIDKFAMDVNGQMMDAELLPADKARQVYEEIVRKQRDPGLLEYMGRGAFRVRIFPIEPNSSKRVRLTYTQILSSDSGLVGYTYPLNTEKFSSRPLNDVSIRVELTSKSPLKSVYSPTHNVEVRYDGDRRATIGYEERNTRPDTDFQLLFSRDGKAVAMDLLSYPTGHGEGYFMLLASPGFTVDPSKIQPKDICFVLDTSGSMAGGKLDQAEKALLFCLDNLNRRDRFEIVRFSTEAEGLFGTLKDAEPDALDRARRFVKDLKPIGGTNIDQALSKALNAPAMGSDHRHDHGRPYIIIFLTDGQPTVGVTNEDALVRRVMDLHTDFDSGTRIFSFGIGTDVNTHLLDRLADQTNALSQYVLPNEDLEVKLSSFYTKIKEPVLANLKLGFGDGVRVSQLYPTSLPDLYKGQSLVVFGRYQLSRSAETARHCTVALSGTVNDRTQQFAIEADLTDRGRDHAFIPRLWATRRVGYLLDEIRLHGESRELKDEVTQLAREYGIVTPYTAYLIMEDERARRVPLALQNLRELSADADARDRSRYYYDSNVAGSAHAEKAGEQAVTNAQAMDSLRRAGQVQTGPAAAAAPALAKGGGGGRGGAAGGPAANSAVTQLGYKVATNYAQQSRVVNGRAFYQNGTTWTDSTAQARSDLKQQQIKFNTDEYFALLSRHPDAAAWLALGNEVDVVIGDTLYQIR